METGAPASPQPVPPGPARAAAYWDMDGTLCRTNIVGPLLYFRWQLMTPVLRELWMASLLVRGPVWGITDKFSRAASNRAIYACYGGLDADATKALAEDCHRQYLRPRIFPQALAIVEEHRSQGVQTVLVTGGIDFLVAPLARELGAALLAVHLEVAPRPGGGGTVFTGRLTAPPLTGMLKVEAVKRHAAEHGVDLARSYAFGDALGDLPMLECVGHPVAVNPGRRLAAAARARGWRTERW